MPCFRIIALGRLGDVSCPWQKCLIVNLSAFVNQNDRAPVKGRGHEHS